MLRYYAYKRNLANGVSILSVFNQESHDEVQDWEQVVKAQFPDLSDDERRKLYKWGNHFLIDEISEKQALQIVGKTLDLPKLLKAIKRKKKVNDSINDN